MGVRGKKKKVRKTCRIGSGLFTIRMSSTRKLYTYSYAEKEITEVGKSWGEFKSLAQNRVR
jgi:hypothetical protein